MKQNLIITGSNSLVAIKLSKRLQKNIKYNISNTHRGKIKNRKLKELNISTLRIYIMKI